MDKFPNLAGEDDVYSSHLTHKRVPRTVFTLDVVSERSPCSLGRIFGLLTTTSFVPDSVGSHTNPDGQIQTSIRVSTDDVTSVDLLVRKSSQLTETVNVDVER